MTWPCPRLYPQRWRTPSAAGLFGDVALIAHIRQKKARGIGLFTAGRICAVAPVVLALLVACLPASLVYAGAPKRVVSFNLCADQLAMMLAAPGQLVSVSALAADPMVSLMPDEARAYPSNNGQAESLYLLDADLILAGTYSSRATVDILRRLGKRVETIPPAASLSQMRETITEMGALLGAEDRAADLLARFDADLAAVPAGGPAPLAATYDANGFTTGRRTLAGDVMRAAGYALLTDQLGLQDGGNLPLEQLILGDPALIINGSHYDRSTRSEEILTHPALNGLTARRLTVPDRDWICGLPHLAQLVAELAAAR